MLPCSSSLVTFGFISYSQTFSPVIKITMGSRNLHHSPSFCLFLSAKREFKTSHSAFSCLLQLTKVLNWVPWWGLVPGDPQRSLPTVEIPWLWVAFLCNLFLHTTLLLNALSQISPVLPWDIFSPVHSKYMAVCLTFGFRVYTYMKVNGFLQFHLSWTFKFQTYLHLFIASLHCWLYPKLFAWSELGLQ